MLFKMKHKIPLLFIKSPYAHWITYNTKTAALLCWIRAIGPESHVSTQFLQKI